MTDILPVNALPETLRVALADYLNGGAGSPSATGLDTDDYGDYTFTHNSFWTGSVARTFSIGLDPGESLNLVHGIAIKFGAERISPAADISRHSAYIVPSYFYFTILADESQGIKNETYADRLAMQIQARFATFMQRGELSLYDWISNTTGALTYAGSPAISKKATWLNNIRPVMVDGGIGRTVDERIAARRLSIHYITVPAE